MRGFFIPETDNTGIDDAHDGIKRKHRRAACNSAGYIVRTIARIPKRKDGRDGDKQSEDGGCSPWNRETVDGS